MSEHTFDAFTRHAATRRTSLATLAGAAMTAGLLTQIGLAAKDNKDKQKAKKAKKKLQKRCNQQKAQCQTALIGADAQAALACCNSCFSGDFFACLLQFT
jgi:hypothetical protein